MDNRVVYYSANDLCYGMHLDKIVDLAIPAIESISLNDAIEFYQMKKYFDEDARLLTWSDEEYALYKSKQKDLTSLCYRYFYNLDDQNIVAAFSTIEFHYASAFWELFDQCKLYKRISNVIFETLLQEKYIHPHDIFEKQNIVTQYGSILKNYILNNSHLIHIVIDAYEQEYTENEKIYLPTSLTGKEICDYITKHIESGQATLHTLQSIYQMKPTKDFPITDTIRFLAKKKYDEQTQTIFENGVKIGYTTSVSFGTQDAVVLENISDHRAEVSYSKAWLLDTLDFPSVLNNFIYLFNYTDYRQMRCLLASQPYHMSPVERIFQNRNLSCCYPAEGISFKAANGLAILQMEAYYTFLQDNNIQLEDVLTWFFTEYLQAEFHCPDMRVKLPSTGATYYEKCTSICTAFESILQQFSLFVEHGEINFELMAIASGGRKYNQIPSLVENKNIYGHGKDFKWITDTLFSDKCIFAYVPRICDQGKSYKSFFELLRNEEVYLSDYLEIEKGAFLKLSDLGILSIDDTGKISLVNETKLFLLYDLYFNGVISRHHYPEETEIVFAEWIKEDILIEGDGLFSKLETDYFNYLLNRVEFINGLDLRNRYMHGVQAIAVDDAEHRNNYYILLIILTIFAIKINDDFTLAEQINSSETHDISTH